MSATKEMNIVELMLTFSEFDTTYQPLKDQGIYILNSTRFIIFKPKERVSQARLKSLLEKIVTYKILVSDPEDRFLTKNEFEHFDDYTRYGADFIQFDFLHITRGKEYLLTNFIKEDENEACISFAVDREYKVQSLSASKKIFKQIEVDRINNNLTDVATWKHNPNNYFGDFNVHIFCSEHYPNCKTKEDIKTRFKELSKIHHPDKGGNDLMFKAISGAKRYLLNQEKALNTQKIGA